MNPPFLLLDVDGVLALRGPAPEGYVEHSIVSSAGDTHVVWLSVQHGAWIRSLVESFQIVWATGWEHDVPRLLGELLQLPPFPVLEFSQRPTFGTRLPKTADVARLVETAPTAWVDDDFDEAATVWSATRAAPTLLISPDSAVGLTETHVAQLAAFAQQV